jgi:hypothetical protein
MTKREAVKLAKRVEKWQKRLDSLGIAHWRIEGVSIVEEMPSGQSANAAVVPSYQYDSVYFWFWREYVDEANNKQLDETIIHEWIHVAMRDFDQAIESVDSELSAGTLASWESRLLHTREGLVDRLARQIYSMYDND